MVKKQQPNKRSINPTLPVYSGAGEVPLEPVSQSLSPFWFATLLGVKQPDGDSGRLSSRDPTTEDVRASNRFHQLHVQSILSGTRASLIVQNTELSTAPGDFLRSIAAIVSGLTVCCQVERRVRVDFGQFRGCNKQKDIR